MGYSDKVLKHYEKPSNVGTLDKNDPTVGTGLVGAPACLHGDTLVLAYIDQQDGKVLPIRELVEVSKTKEVYVSAYNKQEGIVSRRAFNITKTRENSKVYKVVFKDDTSIIATPDHTFLSSDGVTWLETGNLSEGCTLMSLSEAPCVVKDVLTESPCDVYCMTVEQDANFVVITDPENLVGLFSHNCGDVMRLQLKINPETEIIEDAKFKTFGCVTSTTSISTPNGAIRAEDIKEGSVVYSWDGTSITKAVVIEVFKNKTKYEDLRVVGLSDGSSLITSKEHIFVNINGKPLEAEDALHHILYKLSPEDFRGSYTTVTHVTPLFGNDAIDTKPEEYITLYDFKLSGPHIYFTNNVASHNCGSAIAASSLITEWVIGKSLEEAKSIKNSEIAEELTLPPVKLHCSVLAEDAVKSAISDFRKKQALAKKL